jgi:alpha-D-ribose 1-methylphosphonate 5-triphosphate synthase subunit PhnG
VEGHSSIPTFYHGMRCQAVIDAVLQAAQERRWIDVADVPHVIAPLAATSDPSVAPGERHNGKDRE